MTGLEGRTAIVTGAGSGMGRAMALTFAAAGASVVLCGRRAESVNNTLAVIQSTGGQGLAISADVSSAEDVQKVTAAALEAYGRIDILANCAGIAGRGKIHDHDLSTWDKTLDVNLKGPFLMSRAALPAMRAQKSGDIVMISSETALEHYPGSGAYAVAKHALNDLSEIIQRENQSYGVRVHIICPGWTWTDMTHSIRQLDQEKCLQPEDIADLALFLVTRRPGVRIGRPIQIQPMQDPWNA